MYSSPPPITWSTRGNRDWGLESTP